MTKLSFLQCFDALVLYLLEYWAGKAAAPKANATYMQLQQRWWCDGGATVVAVAHNAFHQKSGKAMCLVALLARCLDCHGLDTLLILHSRRIFLLRCLLDYTLRFFAFAWTRLRYRYVCECTEKIVRCTS